MTISSSFLGLSPLAILIVFDLVSGESQTPKVFLRFANLKAHFFPCTVTIKDHSLNSTKAMTA